MKQGAGQVTAIHAIVRGRVQGVFFRAETQRHAEALGLAGWVRNRRDGTVEVFAQGAPAAVDALVDWLREGPPLARVESLAVEPTAIDPALEDFTIRPSV